VSRSKLDAASGTRPTESSLASGGCCGSQSRGPIAQRRRGLTQALALILTVAAVLPVAGATNESPLAVWDVAGRLLVGGGYRDNVLLASVQPESSSFVETTADFSVIRLSESGSSLSFFVLGEFRRFLEDIEADGQPYEGEQLLYATTEWTEPLDSQNTFIATFDYFYQHQVIDASETEANLSRVLIKGHTFTLQPAWEHQLSPVWKVSVEGTAERQIYEAELDDYWQGAAEVRLSRAYGRKSEAAVFYQLRHRFYDSREQYTLAGVPVDGTQLVYRSHEIAGEWRHYWDADRHWRTTVKAGYFLSEDNGSGYFDYERFQLSARLRWKHAGWEISAAARGGWYLYDVQQVEGANLERSYYTVDGRIERWLAKHWLVYVAASREWNLSNDPPEEYNDWVASGGIGVEF
jgi:hypothetical protein